MLLAEDVISCVLDIDDRDDDIELETDDVEELLSEVLDKLVSEETLEILLSVLRDVTVLDDDVEIP